MASQELKILEKTANYVKVYSPFFIEPSSVARLDDQKLLSSKIVALGSDDISENSGYEVTFFPIDHFSNKSNQEFPHVAIDLDQKHQELTGPENSKVFGCAIDAMGNYLTNFENLFNHNSEIKIDKLRYLVQGVNTALTLAAHLRPN